MEERKALRVTAANDDMTMSDFVRAAIAEKIARYAEQQRSENAASAAQHQNDSAKANVPPTLPFGVLVEALQESRLTIRAKARRLAVIFCGQQNMKDGAHATTKGCPFYARMGHVRTDRFVPRWLCYGATLPG